MDPRALLEKTLGLLEAERDAIRRLDIASVDRLADEKETLFGELQRELAASRTPLPKDELTRVVEATRHNCLLLAHARDLTKSAANLVAPERASEAPPLPQAYKQGRRAVRLSVTG